MKCEKRSLALLSSKRTKAYTRTKAEEAFALPSFSDAMAAAVPTRKDYAEDAPAFLDDAIPPSVSAMATKKPSKSSNVFASDPDVERLKQTMLHHEYVFKEQLYELHRLYQVQRSLMAGWGKQNASPSAHHRHPDPPASNSSLLHNSRFSSERTQMDVNHGTHSRVNKSFSRQIDINEPAEDVEDVTDAPFLKTDKTARRHVIFDLERPAEEYLDEDAEEQKPLIRISSENKDNGFLRDSKDNNAAKDTSHRRNWMEEHYRGSSNRNLHRAPTDSFHGSAAAAVTEASSAAIPSAGIPSGQAAIGSVDLRRHISGSQKAAEGEQHRVQGLSNNESDPRAGLSKLPHWISQVSPKLQDTQPLQFVPFASNGNDHAIPFSIRKQENCTQLKSSALVPREQTSSVVKGGQISLQGQEFPGGIFASSSLQELQKTANAHINNKVTPLQSHFLHNGVADDSSIASAKPSTTVHASASFGTCAPHSMFPHYRESDGVRSTSAWLQPTPCSLTVQQSSNFVNLDQLPPHVSSVNPWPNNPPQGTTPNATKKWTHWLDQAIREPVPQSEASIKSGGAIASVFDIEETTAFTKGQVIFGLHGRENTEERHLHTQRSGNHDRYDQTHLPKIGFDLNVLSDEPLDLDEENVDMEASVRHDESGAKTSCAGGKQRSGQSSLLDRDSTFLECAGKEHASEVASSVTQLQEDFGHFSKDTVKNGKCFYAGRDVGGHCEGVKSSDGSGLTSCDSREAAPQTIMKAIEDSNASSGDQSGNTSQNVVETVPMKLQSGTLLCGDVRESARHKHQKPLMDSEIDGSSVVFQLDLNEEYFDVDNAIDTDVTLSNLVDEAADVLLRLGSSLVTDEPDVLRCPERSLKWLADLISTEESNEITSMDIDDTGCSEQGRALDSFELAVLMIKPSVVEDVQLTSPAPPVERHDPVEETNTSRRRSSRRGKANKDFQRDVLPAMAHLSRQEVIEDLQMVEGLIKSATEMTGRSVSPSKEQASPTKQAELGPTKSMGKLKGPKSCRGSKQAQKALLRFCSWGESTRRKRMRRQRSQWLCLPPVS